MRASPGGRPPLYERQRPKSEDYVRYRYCYALHNCIFRAGVVSIIGAEFAAATVLISFGAVLGKVSAFQLLLMAVIEVFLFQVNQYIVFIKLKVRLYSTASIVSCYLLPLRVLIPDSVSQTTAFDRMFFTPRVLQRLKSKMLA